MKKPLLILAVLVVLAGLLYALSPLPAVRGIRDALREDDDVALSRHVDYDALGRNLRAHAEDYVARRAGASVRGNVFGAFAVDVAGRVAGGFVESLATPTGVKTLMAGRVAWRQGTASGLSLDAPFSGEPVADPFVNARYRLESLSRFRVTLAGDPEADSGTLAVNVILERQGLRWKLTDIDLDETDATRTR